MLAAGEVSLEEVEFVLFLVGLIDMQLDLAVISILHLHKLKRAGSIRKVEVGVVLGQVLEGTFHLLICIYRRSRCQNIIICG